MKKMLFVLMAGTLVTFTSCDKNENTTMPYEIEILDVADDGASTVLVNNLQETLVLKMDSLASENTSILKSHPTQQRKILHVGIQVFRALVNIHLN